MFLFIDDFRRIEIVLRKERNFCFQAHEPKNRFEIRSGQVKITLESNTRNGFIIL